MYLKNFLECDLAGHVADLDYEDAVGVEFENRGAGRKRFLRDELSEDAEHSHLHRAVGGDDDSASGGTDLDVDCLLHDTRLLQPVVAFQRLPVARSMRRHC